MQEARLPLSWQPLLQSEFEKPYFKALQSFLAAQIKSGKQVYPPIDKVFRAFEHCQLSAVKVVILGQDPYHHPGQAHGLSFSVNPGVNIPPSLKNIYKELHTDLQIEPATHGYLKSWATQGVLLLNTTLTVEHKLAASHQGQGWEIFTNQVIRDISTQKKNLVFLLWGKAACSKKHLIDEPKHLVLEAAHPSPLSAYRGFFGCQHFSKTNHYLIDHQYSPINWTLPVITTPPIEEYCKK